MSIDQTCLETEIQAAVDNLTTSCSAEVFLETAIAADNANTNRKFTVALGCQLPDLQTANIPAGTTVYVEELGVPVVATGSAWQGLDGRLYRSDILAGQLYTAGRNTYSALLRTGGYECFLQEQYYDTWCDTAGGGAGSFSQVFGIKKDGTMWNWGYVCGPLLSILGNDSSGTQTTPVQEISSSTNWSCVDAACRTGAAIKQDGTLWAWGQYVGDGTTTLYSSPIQEISSSTNWCKVYVADVGYAAIKDDSTLWVVTAFVFGATNSSPTQEYTSSTWAEVSLSKDSLVRHGSAIKTNGTLWSWGCNCFGSLGRNDSIITATGSSPVQEASSSSNWCYISAANCYNAAIKTDGTLWQWGAGNRGAFGDTVTNFSSPVQELCSATNWTLASGDVATAALKSDTTLWGWGQNLCGHLGTGGLTNRCSPVQEVTSNTNWFCVQIYGTVGTAFRCV